MKKPTDDVGLEDEYESETCREDYLLLHVVIKEPHLQPDSDEEANQVLNDCFNYFDFLGSFHAAPLSERAAHHPCSR